MPKYAINKETGERLLYDDRAGRWREPTAAEVKIERMGYVGQAASVAEGATGAMSIAGLFNEKAAATAQALQSINPLSSTAGLAGSLGLAGAPLVRGGMGLLGKAGTISSRVQDGISSGSRMGFRRMPDEMLPPQMSGAGQLVRAGATSTVPGRLATDMLIRVPNQRNLNRLVGRSLRLTDDELKAAGGKIDDSLYGVIQERTNDAYRDVSKRIGASMNKGDVDQLAIKLNAENLITNKKLLAVTDKQADVGDSIMALRSDVRAAQRGEQDTAVRNMMQNTMDEIDAIIEKALDASGDDVAMALYKDANARYKMELAVETGNVLGRDGNISATLLDTQLRKSFGNAYRSGDRLENVPTDLADALQGARIAQGLNIGLPTSGTAERLLGASMVSGLTGGVLGGSL